jgi:DNA-directed RNA polymerase specialized sigma24 family protein
MHVRVEPERHGHRRTRTSGRPLLSIAYGIVGSVSEAADIVQEAFLHVTGNGVRMRTRPAKAWLSTVTTRLAIDQVRSGATRAA